MRALLAAALLVALPASTLALELRPGDRVLLLLDDGAARDGLAALLDDLAERGLQPQVSWAPHAVTVRSRVGAEVDVEQLSGVRAVLREGDGLDHLPQLSPPALRAVHAFRSGGADATVRPFEIPRNPFPPERTPGAGGLRFAGAGGVHKVRSSYDDCGWHASMPGWPGLFGRITVHLFLPQRPLDETSARWTDEEVQSVQSNLQVGLEALAEQNWNAELQFVVHLASNPQPGAHPATLLSRPHSVIADPDWRDRRCRSNPLLPSWQGSTDAGCAAQCSDLQADGSRAKVALIVRDAGPGSSVNAIGGSAFVDYAYSIRGEGPGLMIHEICHLFGAIDEHGAACLFFRRGWTAGEPVANTGCERGGWGGPVDGYGEGQAGLMGRYHNFRLSGPQRRLVGWGDPRGRGELQLERVRAQLDAGDLRLATDRSGWTRLRVSGRCQALAGGVEARLLGPGGASSWQQMPQPFEPVRCDRELHLRLPPGEWDFELRQRSPTFGYPGPVLRRHASIPEDPRNPTRTVVMADLDCGVETTAPGALRCSVAGSLALSQTTSWPLSYEAWLGDRSVPLEGDTLELTLTREGAHEIRVLARDPFGNTGTDVAQVTVSSRRLPPVAHFTVTPAMSFGVPELTVALDASESSYPPQPAAPLRFRWDFDSDGRFDTDWSPDPRAETQLVLPTHELRIIDVPEPDWGDLEPGIATSTVRLGSTLFAIDNAHARLVAIGTEGDDTGRLLGELTVPGLDPDRHFGGGLGGIDRSDPDLLYLAAGEHSLVVVDIGDPRALIVANVLDLGPTRGTAIQLHHSHIYALYESELVRYAYSDPRAPVLASRTPLPLTGPGQSRRAWGLAMDDDLACVTTLGNSESTDYLHVLRVPVRDEPRVEATVDLDHAMGVETQIWDVEMKDAVCYVANGEMWPAGGNGVAIFDVIDPQRVSSLGELEVVPDAWRGQPFGATAVAISGDRMFVNWSPSGIVGLYDISRAGQPRLLAHRYLWYDGFIPLDGGPHQLELRAAAVLDRRGERAFVLSQIGGLKRIDFIEEGGALTSQQFDITLEVEVLDQVAQARRTVLASPYNSPPSARDIRIERREGSSDVGFSSEFDDADQDEAWEQLASFAWPELTREWEERSHRLTVVDALGARWESWERACPLGCICPGMAEIYCPEDVAHHGPEPMVCTRDEEGRCVDALASLFNCEGVARRFGEDCVEIPGACERCGSVRYEVDGQGYIGQLHCRDDMACVRLSAGDEDGRCMPRCNPWPCPEGFTCRPGRRGDEWHCEPDEPDTVCAEPRPDLEPRGAAACTPCERSESCPPAGGCTELGNGRVCLEACSYDVECRADWECAAIPDVEGRTFRGCRPVVGDCGCVPDCAGSECGDDGCGGACGGCGEGEVCVDGLCGEALAPGASCETTAHCGSAAACVRLDPSSSDGQCVERCSDAACAPGLRCRSYPDGLALCLVDDGAAP